MNYTWQHSLERLSRACELPVKRGSFPPNVLLHELPDLLVLQYPTMHRCGPPCPRQTWQPSPRPSSWYGCSWGGTFWTLFRLAWLTLLEIHWMFTEEDAAKIRPLDDESDVCFWYEGCRLTWLDGRSFGQTPSLANFVSKCAWKTTFFSELGAYFKYTISPMCNV